MGEDFSSILKINPLLDSYDAYVKAEFVTPNGLKKIENFIEVYDFLGKQGISTKIKSYKDLENLVVKFNRKKIYSQQIIKKLTYTGNQILLKNEKEINKYC